MWGVTLFLLAFAVSLDSLGVGVAYGMKNIRIPFKSIFVIALCSGTVMFIAMNVGAGLKALLPVNAANALGAVILIGIGIWALFSGEHSLQEESAPPSKASSADPLWDETALKQVWSVEIKKLGLVIRILRKPSMADMDRSGTISAGEAVLLGCALSLDAFAAGLGVAMVGLSLWTAPLLVALMGVAFLLTGLHLGLRFQTKHFLKKLQFLPGGILILMGLSRFWW